MKKNLTTASRFKDSLYDLFKNGLSEKELNEKKDVVSSLFEQTFIERLSREKRQESLEKGLRLSIIGWPCPRKIWYQVNTPEKQEDLLPKTRLKFLYGDLIEDIVLASLCLAGHDVRGRQKEVEVEGVKGHIDAIIDGVLVDVKSVSSLSLKKFKEGVSESNDPFGYKFQLAAYSLATGIKDCAFIAVDKQHGDVVIDEHSFSEEDYENVLGRIRYLKEVCSKDDPPERAFSDVPDGKSGNRKLGLECSYCSFKKECWPGLRTFLYSKGPRFLTKVEKEPEVEEVM